MTTIETVGSKLLKEIERVAGLRARYEGLRDRGIVKANFEPVIALMTAAIANARDAITDDDGIRSIAALRDLEGFSE